MTYHAHAVKADTIVGYTFQAEILCPLHALHAATGPDRDPWRSVEDQLSIAALHRDINRFDESSFDSDEFPKIIFAADVGNERCMDVDCGEYLIEHDEEDQ